MRSLTQHPLTRASCAQFDTRSRALRWAETSTPSPCVYIIVFEKFFKLGSSHNLRERFYQLLRWNIGGGAFVKLCAGPETLEYRKLERALHVTLFPFRWDDGEDRSWGSGPRELYERSASLELLLFEWMESAYSPEGFTLIEDEAETLERAQEAA